MSLKNLAAEIFSLGKLPRLGCHCEGSLNSESPDYK